MKKILKRHKAIVHHFRRKSRKCRKCSKDIWLLSRLDREPRCRQRQWQSSIMQKSKYLFTQSSEVHSRAKTTKVHRQYNVQYLFLRLELRGEVVGWQAGTEGGETETRVRCRQMSRKVSLTKTSHKHWPTERGTEVCTGWRLDYNWAPECCHSQA